MLKLKWIAILVVTLFIGRVFGQTNSLPKPTGKYFVGVTYLGFTDEKRTELFDNDQKLKRNITVKAWYPAAEKSKPEPYLRNMNFAIKYMILPENMKNLMTNSSLNMPLSIDLEKYPILLFSHGWGEQNSQNTILMEELASHGFIVFSVAHPYECKYSEYPDGKISHIEFGSLRFQKIMREQQSPKAMELLMRLYGATQSDERMQIFRETAEAMPTLFASPKYWTEDLSFFLDQIKGINESNGILKGKMDINRIGALGMSLGGVVTSEICLHDRRVKAGISMDGGMYGSLLEEKMNVPFMFLSGKRFAGCGPLFSDKSAKDCYAFAIKNADHYNFTDHALFPYPMIQFMLGTIDGKRALEITNALVLSFFKKYLENKKEVNLLTEAAKFPEIEISSNLTDKKEGCINILEEVNLGGVKQWIFSRGDSASNPVLLFLHGGPGFPEMPFTHIDSKLLEKHFIVVNWDQRGAGKTGDAGTAPEMMTIDRYLADTHELIELLKTRFQKKKIFLIGHSWGSILGLLTAHRYPESIHAYIGMGQVVNIRKSEALSYAYTLAKARELKDEGAVKQLVEIGPPDGWKNYRTLEIHRILLEKFKGVFKKYTYRELLKLWFTSPHYTQSEKQNLLISYGKTQEIMWPIYMPIDLAKKVRKMKVPTYFFTGRFDYATHFDLVTAYCQALKAPHKEMVWFEESGHHPNLDEPEKYQETLINKILKNTKLK